jgi:hypothetical protein
MWSNRKEGGSPTYARNEMYDPSSDEWQTRQSMSTRRDNPVGYAFDGRVTILGGSLGSSLPFVFPIERYDPSGDVWTYLGSLSFERRGLSIGVVDTLVFIIGGWEITGDSAEVNIFNPRSGVWSNGSPMPTARSYASCVALDGKLYVMGGSIYVGDG